MAPDPAVHVGPSADMARAIHDISERFVQMMARKGAPDNQQSLLSGRTTTGQGESASVASDAEYKRLMALSRQPFLYEDPALLDEALNTIALDKIYLVADEASAADDTLGYQDHVIKALLKWFKEDFFQWVNSPTCSTCGGQTTPTGSTRPNQEESRLGASRTELYRCNETEIHIERFPRYDSPKTLLTWRKGRCGEFANCFTLLCIALGSRARWVYNYEDHVWTEVYSTKLQRWIHCDACENAWDAPQMYAVGWGKKMSHCVAFAVTGAQDVSRRYVRCLDPSAPPRVPMEVMSRAISDINRRNRAAFSEAAQEQYRSEDLAEEKELAAYLDSHKVTSSQEAAPRLSGSAEWKQSRGESGDAQS